MSVGEALDKEERPAYIQFETRAVENKKESLKQGHYVGTDVDFVMVTLPGGRDVYESKVDSWFENKERQTKNGRVDPEHLKYYRRAYAAFKEGQSIPIDGTPIKGWGAVSPAQEKTVIMAGIRTIEDLAASNDEALRRLGMGGRDIVNKAKSWLKSAGDHGKVALENAELIKQNKILTTTVESLEEKVELLARKVETINIGADNDNMQQVQRGTSSQESEILPGMSREIHEGEQTKTLGTFNGSEDASELPSVRERIQEEGEANTGELQGMREQGQSDAPPGLQQTAESDVDVQGLSLSLAQQYEQKFGKKPHHRMKDETMQKMLEE